eukprot:scaffold9445_cov59-Phaeocystis_antarctica.AAC.3
MLDRRCGYEFWRLRPERVHIRIWCVDVERAAQSLQLPLVARSERSHAHGAAVTLVNLHSHGALGSTRPTIKPVAKTRPSLHDVLAVKIPRQQRVNYLRRSQSKAFDATSMWPEAFDATALSLLISSSYPNVVAAAAASRAITPSAKRQISSHSVQDGAVPILPRVMCRRNKRGGANISSLAWVQETGLKAAFAAAFFRNRTRLREHMTRCSEGMPPHDHGAGCIWLPRLLPDLAAAPRGSSEQLTTPPSGWCCSCISVPATCPCPSGAGDACAASLEPQRDHIPTTPKPAPVVPRYAVRTARPRLDAYGVPQYWAPRGKLPCASGTYSTQEASARSPYVQYGGPGACV